MRDAGKTLTLKATVKDDLRMEQRLLWKRFRIIFKGDCIMLENKNFIRFIDECCDEFNQEAAYDHFEEISDKEKDLLFKLYEYWKNL